MTYYDKPRPDVAVFIDFENVYVSVRDKLDANPNFEMIMDRCNDLGRVVLARAYADWYRYPRITSALYANAIEPIYVATYYYDKDVGRTGRAIKNSVDMNLCIDAMKTLFIHQNISKFVLVTGDRDFIPLVHSIRQQGKEVTIIGIGGAASTHLAQSADEFVFYEQLIGKEPPSAADVRTSSRDAAREAARIAAAQFADEEPLPVVVPPPVATPPAREERNDRNGRNGRDNRNDDRNGRNRNDNRSERSEERIEERPERSERPERTRNERSENRPEREPSPSLDEVYRVLTEAILLVRKRGYVSTLGSIKLVMKELMGSDFKEGRYRDLQGRPFNKFKDFVVDAERRGKVQIFTNGTVNEVFLPGEDPYKLSQFAGELTREEPIVEPIVDVPVPPPPVILPPPPARAKENGESKRDLNNRRRRRRPRNEREPSAPLDIPEVEPIEMESVALDAADELQALDALEPIAEVLAFHEETPADEILPIMETTEEVAATVEALADLTTPIMDEVVPEPELEYTPPIGEPEPVAVEPEPVAVEPEPVAAASDEEEGDDAATVEVIDFTDEEWETFRQIAGKFTKPVSFNQIFDALRSSRKDYNLQRTNEQLRTMVKQAISREILERSGRGKRVYYSLPASGESATAEPTAE